MSIRLNKVTKECNVGLQTVVEVLQKKGFEGIEANPNTKISEEQYEILLKEFNRDKGLRSEATQLIRQRQEQTRGKRESSRSKRAERARTERTEVIDRPRVEGPKVVGHIDLDAPKAVIEKITPK